MQHVVLNLFTVTKLSKCKQLQSKHFFMLTVETEDGPAAETSLTIRKFLLCNWHIYASSFKCTTTNILHFLDRTLIKKCIATYIILCFILFSYATLVLKILGLKPSDSTAQKCWFDFQKFSIVRLFNSDPIPRIPLFYSRIRLKCQWDPIKNNNGGRREVAFHHRT